MKKITKDIGKLLPSAILYYEDIENIIDIFQELSDNISISTENYEYSSLDELKKNEGTVINILNISVSNSFTYLDLNKEHIYLRCANNNLEYRGAFEKIKQLILSGKRKLSWLTYIPLIPVCAIGVSLGMIVPKGAQKIYSSVTIAGIVTFTLGFILLRLTYINRYKQYTIIYLKRKSELPNFFIRNKDKIILIFFSALISSVLTYLLAK